jgi:hypothetical protein
MNLTNLRLSLIVFAIALPRLALAELSQDYSLTSKKFAKLSADEKKILGEYPANFANLRKFYQNVTMEAYLRLSLSVKQPGNLVFRGNGGDNFRLDSVYEEGGSSSHAVGIVTPSAAYLLYENPTNDKYAMSLYSKDRTRGLNLLLNYRFQVAPFSSNGTPLIGRVCCDRPNCTIDKVEVLKEDGDNIVAVTQSCKFGKSDWCHDVVRFYRDKCWAMKDVTSEGSVFGTPAGSALTIERCTYDGEKDGIPILKVYTFESGVRMPGGKIEPTVSEHYEIKTTPGAAPLSYFDVDTLLGKTKPGETVGFSRFRVICVLVGVIFVLLGILIRRRVSKASSR